MADKSKEDEGTTKGKAPATASKQDNEPPGNSKPTRVSFASGSTSEDSQTAANMIPRPSATGQISGTSEGSASQALENVSIRQMLEGMGLGKKTHKEMESYKFWQTQPVPRFDESTAKPDGEIKKIDPEKVPKEPRALLEGFEWVTMDLEDTLELTEVYELLNAHYVEDEGAQFRLNYSASFFNWALKSPGWKKEWHVGVRATKSKKLLAFISAIPGKIRIRDQVLNASEVNFLCIHKKLRSKRLAPILIEEITRRCYREGVYQAIYTGGQILPKPLASCRYFHRSIDWAKLYDCGFAGLPANTTPQRQLTRTFIPASTALTGFRLMEKKDIPRVHDLLTRYLRRFLLTQEFTLEEIEHWLYYDPKASTDDQMVWAWVVEHEGKITDVTTVYRLDSSIINNKKHGSIKAAYLYYYATETAFTGNEKALKDRLNALVLDTLVVLKKLSFDVCNALSLLDNPMFLKEQKFGPGDGQLHYYLYNYRAAAVPGGINARNDADEAEMGGVGVVML